MYHEDRGAQRPSFLRRVFLNRQSVPVEQEIHRLNEKRRALQRATDQWLSLLRDMEQQGQSGAAAYERYYTAYLDAKQQQKGVELRLFNLRTGGQTA